MRTLKKHIHESHSLRFARSGCPTGLLTNHALRELLPHGLLFKYTPNDNLCQFFPFLFFLKYNFYGGSLIQLTV